MTRLPCEGRNKTRLTPSLGAAGAAQFHDRLARHTIRHASEFCAANGTVKLVIWLAGGSPEEGRQWLGNHYLKEQKAGDLGVRIASAVECAFAEGAQRVVVIGTDCPELDGRGLEAAFAALDDFPLVFGPACDGGYYLVGLRERCPAIFENIGWGGASVLAESLAAAQSSGASACLLEMLPDVDTPEDLAAAEIALSQRLGINQGLDQSHLRTDTPQP